MIRKNRKKNILNNKQVQGATLLEVLVSVFIMAFGIMALMLAQLKSVGSIREAEMQTRVAQAAQNLAEGMLSNPDVRVKIEDATQYTAYVKSANLNLAGSVGITQCNGTRISVITCHHNNFEADLRRALPGASAISYIIDRNGTITVSWKEVNDSDTFDFSYTLQVGS